MSINVTQAHNSASNTAEVEPIDKSTVHQLLSNARRRYIIQAIAEHGTLAKRPIVDFVASEEIGKPVAELTSDERKRVHVSVHQQHLPTLVEEQVLEESDDGYGFGPNACYVFPHMDIDTQSDKGLFGFFR